MTKRLIAPLFQYQSEEALLSLCNYNAYLLLFMHQAPAHPLAAL